MRQTTKSILLLLISLLLIFNNSYSQQKSKKNNEMKEENLREVVILETSYGNITIDFFENIAPKLVENFKNLTKSQFFDSIYFHRVIPGFVVQGGDPSTKGGGNRENAGMGQPGQPTVPAEFSNLSHKRGILSMARKGNDINSATSQFFICVADVGQLDGQYSVFGKVLEGMDVVDKIVAAPRDGKDNPLESIFILKAYTKYLPLPEPEENVKPKNEPCNTDEIVVLETSLGIIKFGFYDKIAPKHTAQIKTLINEKFYDGTTFHRVIPNFMIQGGDPNSKSLDKSTHGMGNSHLPNIPAEFSKLRHIKGTVAAARSNDPNSANSQFFINVNDNFFLDNQYTVFGEVIEGMDIAEKIVNVDRDERDNPNERVVINKAYLAIYNGSREEINKRLLAENQRIEQERPRIEQARLEKERKEEQEKRQKLTSKYGKTTADKIIAGKLEIGMTKAVCKELATNNGYLVSIVEQTANTEKWKFKHLIWDSGKYLYFNGDKLAKIVNY
jgi:cyclophilin family peptidyl-prolyl cis-trans isomerase